MSTLTKLALSLIALAAVAVGLSLLREEAARRNRFSEQCEAQKGIPLVSPGGEALCVSRKGVVLRGV